MKTDDQLLGIVSSAIARHRDLRLDLESKVIEELIQAVIIDRACDDLKSVISDLTSPELLRLADLLASNMQAPTTAVDYGGTVEVEMDIPPHPLDLPSQDAPQPVKKRRGRPPKNA